MQVRIFNPMRRRNSVPETVEHPREGEFDLKLWNRALKLLDSRLTPREKRAVS